jgi:hypothetical protein
MVLDFFHNPEQTDDEIYAIGHKANGDENDQGLLTIAYAFAQGALEAREVDGRAGKVVIPGCPLFRCAWYEGGEEIIETKGECGRPGADEDDVKKSVEHFAGGPP